MADQVAPCEHGYSFEGWHCPVCDAPPHFCEKCSRRLAEGEITCDGICRYCCELQDWLNRPQPQVPACIFEYQKALMEFCDIITGIPEPRKPFKRHASRNYPGDCPEDCACRQLPSSDDSRKTRS